jgi:integrase/recombinase XerD
MLEDQFRLSHLGRRIVNPNRRILERYAEYLTERGYAPSTRHEYISAADHFGRWRARRRVNWPTVQQFLRRHLPTCRCPARGSRNPNTNRAALRNLLEMLGHGPAAPPCSKGYAGHLLQRYAERLTRDRGLAATSVQIHINCTRAMLSRMQVRRRSQLAKWSPDSIQRYVSQVGRRCPGSGRKITGCTRSFLNFLLEEGLIRRDLAAAVPTFARWRLAPLPETLRKEEIARLVRGANVRTPLGRRDRAIVLCLSELGLRASDVAGLELGGIDLAHRVLRLRRRKERETTTLPIPTRLATALGAYLRDGRPGCTSSAVFVRHYAPVGKPITPVSVCNVVLRLAKRAGLRDRVGGTHVLRHSIASRMLSAGATLKQIADLLGHQSIDTTSIYAKVDLRTLSRVALPWPGTKGACR